jgi:hypothetical protein
LASNQARAQPAPASLTSFAFKSQGCADAPGAPPAMSSKAIVISVKARNLPPAER